MNAKKNLNRRSNEEVGSLFKMMLMMVEDMKKDHDFHYDKLYQEIPDKYHPVINTADHFTEDKVSWIRKRILDYGNESLRSMKNELENYKVEFIFK